MADDMQGVVEALAITPELIPSTSLEEVEATLEGLVGDKHYGLTMKAKKAQAPYPKGGLVRNVRQLSIVSAEELAQVAEAMGVERVEPAWLGANLLISGVPDLTQLSPGSRLYFEGGAGVVVEGQHIGGGYKHPFGYLKLTQAAHGSGFPDGFPGGTASGFLLTTPEGRKVYLGCDTGLFGDMALIGDEGVDFAALPIGDNFTMGPDDALKAVKLLRPKRVMPYHYSTWDVIKQDERAWVERVNAETDADAFVMQPGDTLEI